MSTSQSYKETLDVTLDSTLADSPPIPYGSFTAGLVEIPTGSSITDLAEWYVSDTENGTYIQIYNSSNVAVGIATVGAARAYPFPAEVQGAAWLKIVPNADGAVKLHLKSQT